MFPSFLAEVYVVGSGSKLGSWSPDGALLLTTGPQVRKSTICWVFDVQTCCHLDVDICMISLRYC